MTSVRATGHGRPQLHRHLQSRRPCPQPLRFVFGIEGTGAVQEVGDGVAGLRPGERVAYAGVIGGYCDVRNVPAGRLVKLPEGISEETAAAVLLQGLTAPALLKDIPGPPG